MSVVAEVQSWTQHPTLQKWIQDVALLCKPKEIHFCTGSKQEYDSLIQLLVEKKTLTPLNPEIRPGSYLARSDSKDVARVEGSTYICSPTQEQAGPTNHWEQPQKMQAKLDQLFDGCMQGRTMYVIPYCMGPVGSPLSYVGVEITDSAYVAVSMMIMARVSTEVLDFLGTDKPFIPGLHSVGVPLKEGQKDSPWPCNPDNRHIVHFPQTKKIYSFGSGYGGNALLGKKCFALRIASVLAREEGWFAEHMLILGLTNPEGQKKYFAAAFPSACGKTNLAMMNATLKGWKVECVGDDIAWMRFKEDGKLYAINPEHGFFGVAPGTSFKSNPNAMYSMSKNTLFTNVALTPNGDVWWEGMDDQHPTDLIDWQGKPFSCFSGNKAAHPNSRFTAPASQCPIIDPKWDDPEGVHIEGIIFGGRRANTIPLALQSFDWNHGVFMGASIASEMTAAAEGQVGQVRQDPFAMLPFCGYNMGDYFQHWIDMGKNRDPKKLPKIFSVNWFQKDTTGNFIWPGFGENCRVLKWMFESINGKEVSATSAVGHVPHPQSFSFTGLDLSESTREKLFEVDPKLWKQELERLKEYFSQFGRHFPNELKEQLEKIESRLNQN